MSNKSHYRNVYKSDHLSAADIEDFIEQKRSLVFTIKEVIQHELIAGDRNSGVIVTGKRISANIAHFVENIKPMVLNATNGKIVRSLAGGSPFVQDWKNIKVEVYVDPNVKMKGEVVGGLRIRKQAPAPPTKEEIETQVKEATSVSQLTNIRSYIQKYNLTLLASARANEIKNGL